MSFPTGHPLEPLSRLIELFEELEKLKSRLGRLPNSPLRDGLSSLVTQTEQLLYGECEQEYLVKCHEADQARVGLGDPPVVISCDDPQT